MIAALSNTLQSHFLLSTSHAISPPTTKSIPLPMEEDLLAESIARELRKLCGLTKAMSLDGYLHVMKPKTQATFSRDTMFSKMARPFIHHQMQMRPCMMALATLII